LIIVDVLALTEAFVGTVCLIAVRHTVSGRIGCRCGRVGKTPRLNNRVDRWIKETIHIRMEQDMMMNRDEGSYQLSHIYDNLFAPKLSGERRLNRLFRWRLQPKPKRQQ